MCGVFRPLNAEIVSEFGISGVHNSVALLGIAVAIGTEVVGYAFLVILGHSDLGAGMEIVVDVGEDGVARGSRVTVKAGDNDGFWIVVVSGAVYPLLAPSA